MPDPVRGEIWWVDFEPGVGAEARFVRPAVVLSAANYYHLPVRIVVPLTTWQERFERQPNKVRIPASRANGLDVDSAADALLVRSASTDRFRSRAGQVEADLLADIAAALAVAVAAEL